MTGETFEALLAPNLPSVRRFVQMRMRTHDHADDVIQQALLRAFVRRDQLRASSKFRSWLCSIAMNEVRMFFRTGRPTMSLHEFPQIDSRDSGHRRWPESKRWSGWNGCRPAWTGFPIGTVRLSACAISKE